MFYLYRFWGKYFCLSVCLFDKSWRTDINHDVIVGPIYVIEYECLFNYTCMRCFPLEMVYGMFNVAQPEVVGEDEYCTFIGTRARHAFSLTL